jgi:hypothetical protein
MLAGVFMGHVPQGKRNWMPELRIATCFARHFIMRFLERAIRGGEMQYLP